MHLSLAQEFHGFLEDQFFPSIIYLIIGYAAVSYVLCHVGGREMNKV